MNNDTVGIIVDGILGSLVLCFIVVTGTFLYLHPIDTLKALSIVAGIPLFVYSLGWCIYHYQDFKDLLHLKREVLEKVQPEISFRIPVIGKLEAFEEKYYITTVRFMIYVHDNQIPYGMNNLDYLEWLSLVNELPSINNNEQGE